MVFDLPTRQDVEPLEQRFRFAAPVGLGEDDDVRRALGPALAGGLQHGVGLADAGAHPEEELQASPSVRGLFLLHAAQQGLGGGPAFVRSHGHDRQRRQGSAGITRQEKASFRAMSPTLMRPSTTSALR